MGVLLLMRPISIYSNAIFLVISLSLLFSCDGGIDIRQEQSVSTLLEEAERLTSQSRYDEAVSLAFDALKIADSGEKIDQALSHLTLSKLFLQTSRDSLSFEHACQAEDIAVQERDDSLLAAALLLKGKVCSYSNFSAEQNRDDEGIEYLENALTLAEPRGWNGIVAESCYFLCELYINKNRWNDVLDRQIYRKAGEWLEKAEEIDGGKTSARALSSRMRYLRQGDKTDEAIGFCTRIIGETPETDYLKLYQIYDHLTILYLRKGNTRLATEAHQSYSYYMQLYMRQKGDDILQDLQTEYQTELKDRQIKTRTGLVFILSALFILALAAIVQFIRLNRQISQKNKSIQAIARSREMLFAVIAKDLYDPALAGIKDSHTLDFIRKWPTMSEDEIRQRCASLSEGDAPMDPVVVNYISELMISRKKSLGTRGLSSRELEIISLSKEGLSDKQIADKLCLSARTVSNHKYRIYSKLEVSGNTEMLAKAEELGL